MSRQGNNFSFLIQWSISLFGGENCSNNGGSSSVHGLINSYACSASPLLWMLACAGMTGGDCSAI